MEISALTLKLIILLTPGALAAIIVKRLTVNHKPSSDFMFVLDAVLLGMFSYLILQICLIVWIWIGNICSPHKDYHTLQVFRSIADSSSIPYKEIIFACIFAIALGFFVSRIIEKRIINRIAIWMKVTQKYGDLNLFSHYLNAKSIEYVYIRDIKNSLTYLGYVSACSETTEYKELVLGDVTVFTYPESDELYDVQSIYLCFPKDEIKIEKAKIK